MAERRRAVRRRSRSEWQDVLARLEASGEEVGRFCQHEGIYPPTLRWWRWHLAGPGGGDDQRARRSGVAVVGRSGPSFTELRVLATAGKTDEAARFELRWSDGLTLVIPQQFDVDALQCLLAVLEVAGC
jgi:transposase-like protein